MYVVLFTGPEPIVMPISRAANSDEASALAIRALEMYLHRFDKPYAAKDFRVEHVAGPQ